MLMIICYLLPVQFSTAQNDPYNHAVCDTRVSDTGYYMRNAKAFLANAQQLLSPQTISMPYVIRVFIRIVRETDGTLPGCTMAQAIQNFTEMNGQYNSHNICFQLVGIDFINDSYLNNFNTAANIPVIYPNYIRNNNLDVEGAMTIFIHYNYLNNNGSSGNAYGIPNNFISVARWAATSPNVHSIFGHEIGHCLGLFHTFERFTHVDEVYESVTRTISNSCYNCPTEGDLCCDTPADYDAAPSYTNSTTCVYSSNIVGTCDQILYNPSTVNIMSYMPWTCISTTGTALSTDQQTRMHATINDQAQVIYPRVAHDDAILTSVSNSINKIVAYSAKNNLNTANGATIIQAGSTNAYYIAGSKLVFSPGVTFSPGAAGMVDIRIGSCN